jgi:glutathione-regulated potassium-efflux system ancillary protein KefG
MPRVLLLFAHPRLEKSRANKALLKRLPQHADLTFVDLYELYPQFNVDIAAEQARLIAHDIIVLHHPFYWYNAPPLVKQWIDLVLSFGWAYGPGGTALTGKTWFHAITTGGPSESYQLNGFHGWTLAEFMRPLQRTATLCGMTWLPPFAALGTHRLSDDALDRLASQYRELLEGLISGTLALDQLASLHLLNEALPQRTRP